MADKRNGRPTNHGVKVEPRSITVIPEEWEVIQAEAAATGKSVSQVLRELYHPGLQLLRKKQQRRQ